MKLSPKYVALLSTIAGAASLHPNASKGKKLTKAVATAKPVPATSFLLAA